MHDQAALARAIELASRGPRAGGNPRVGCVIADDAGKIAEGFHAGAGSPHAEAVALGNVADADRARLAAATAYVTLEPCNHHGRTPPCAQALIDNGIGRVVFATADPNPAARGGATRLREAGVRVETARTAGIEEYVIAFAEDLTHSWRTAIARGTPWVIAKTACTLDGRIAAADGTSKWITGVAARERAHEIRADVDAIVVGTGTFLADAPTLTARRPDGSARSHQPLRVVVGERDVSAGEGWLQVRTHRVRDVLDALGERGLRHVLVEGGAGLLGAFASDDAIDEINAYLAPMWLGAGLPAVGDFGVQTLAAAPRWRTRTVEQLGDDVLITAWREIVED